MNGICLFDSLEPAARRWSEPSRYELLRYAKARAVIGSIPSYLCFSDKISISIMSALHASIFSSAKSWIVRKLYLNFPPFCVFLCYCCLAWLLSCPRVWHVRSIWYHSRSSRNYRVVSALHDIRFAEQIQEKSESKNLFCYRMQKGRNFCYSSIIFSGFPLCAPLFVRFSS